MKIVQSWDTAIKAGRGRDASVCLTFSHIEEGQHRLMDVWVGRVEYPTLKRRVLQLAADWHPHAILIEDKASGQSLIQDVRRETDLPVIPVLPKGDKLTRLAQVSPMIEAGLLALPKEAAWLAAFEAELLGFPHAAHDDQVDALSQYLNWVRERQSGFRRASFGNFRRRDEHTC
jgi:predicted phage terminase large subunit-like protein